MMFVNDIVGCFPPSEATPTDFQSPNIIYIYILYFNIYIYYDYGTQAIRFCRYNDVKHKQDLWIIKHFSAFVRMKRDNFASSFFLIFYKLFSFLMNITINKRTSEIS